MNTQPEQITSYSEVHPFGIACDEPMTDSYPFTGMTQEQEDRLLPIALENINVSLLRIVKFEWTWRRELGEKKRQEQKKTP